MTSIPAVSERIRWVPRLGQTSQAAAWTFFAFGATQVLRLASNVLLAHLLFPEAFGLTAIAGAILAGLQMFSDIGLAPSLVRSARGEDPAFRNTAWTLGVIRGLILWAFAAALAYPVGQFYDPQLAKILPVAGSVCLIAALASTSLAVLGRRMHLRGVALLDLGSTALGIVITCVWAWLSPTVWSIIGGALIAASVRTIVSWGLIAGHRDHFMLERAAVTELFGFGRWIFVSTLITFLALHSDRLMVGRLLTMAEVGVYAIAMSLIVMPRELISRLAGSVQYPVLARCFRERPEHVGKLLTRTRLALMLLSQWAILAIAMGAQGFFALLYDARYADAASLSRWLSLSAFIGALSITADRALLAVGDSRALATSNFARAIALFPGCLLGYMWFGLPGFAVGLAGSAAAGHCVLVLALISHGINVVLDDVWHIATFCTLLALPLLAAAWLQLGTWFGIDVGQAVCGLLVLLPLGAIAAIRATALMGLQRQLARAADRGTERSPEASGRDGIASTEGLA